MYNYTLDYKHDIKPELNKLLEKSTLNIISKTTTLSPERRKRHQVISENRGLPNQSATKIIAKNYLEKLMSKIISKVISYNRDVLIFKTPFFGALKSYPLTAD